MTHRIALLAVQDMTMASTAPKPIDDPANIPPLWFDTSFSFFAG
jgi:hypothetical protein